MRTNLPSLIALLALAFGQTACSTPPPVEPAAEHVAVNDGRSIEHCTTLGLVSATLPVTTLAMGPYERFLTPKLRDDTAARGGNYVEAMPVQCTHGQPCAESGVAYRCPAS
ncbi:MAG: hypothetical protein ACRELY_00075 [Polyangiaceae bacterium]